jgi:hypothetical protein
LELPRGISTTQLAGGYGLPAALSPSARIEQSFRQRLEALPDDTLRLLLVAAAEPTGDPALLWQAAERLGIRRVALEPAELEGLIEVDSRVRFRHPLVRSAVYQATKPKERRRAHWALAEATDARLDPDRRAWHLAEAAARPDETVAAELEQAAGRAQARGGLAAAAAFLERAATLTPEPSRRAERALSAAQTQFEAGALDEAVALLATADAGAVDHRQRAQVKLLRARITFAVRRGSDAPSLLLQAAGALEAVDPRLARETYLEALSAAIFAGRFAREGGSAREVSEAALAGPPPSQPPRPSDLLLQGLAVLFTDGYAAAARIMKEAVRAFRPEAVLPPAEHRWLFTASMTATLLWDDEAWAVITKLHIDLVRATGALTALPFILAGLSGTYASFGELGMAASYVGELAAATEAMGIAPFSYPSIWRAALRGREAELSELSRPVVSEAKARGEGLAVAMYAHVAGILYNGLGRYDTARANECRSCPAHRRRSRKSPMEGHRASLPCGCARARDR